MNLSTLITELRAAGASLRAVDGRVGVSPRSALTPERREAIRAHRSALLAMLTASVAAPPPTCLCRSCRRSRWWRPRDDAPEPGVVVGPASGWTCAACHPPARADVIWDQGGTP